MIAEMFLIKLTKGHVDMTCVATSTLPKDLNNNFISFVLSFNLSIYSLSLNFSLSGTVYKVSFCNMYFYVGATPLSERDRHVYIDIDLRSRR